MSGTYSITAFGIALLIGGFIFLLTKLSPAMRRVTIMLGVVECVNWFIDWHWGWQILFSLAGVSIFIMFYAMENAQPEPEVNEIIEDESLC